METSQNMPSGIRRLMRPKIVVPVAVFAIAVGAFVLYWFQPQALFLNKTVDEKAPEAMMSKDSIAKGDDAMKKEDGAMKADGDKMTGDKMMALSGSFRGLKYETTGKAILIKEADGNYILRLENFETQNGPDLKVYLSTASSKSDSSTFDDDFVSLGALKGNMGNQNYKVPSGTDVSKYRSVVIWCKRFTVGFGVAPLPS